ncbi:hypothetical protein P5P86_00030 [Nocardioides sp. BP30]|uniref:hypothetical protein n=1 Tax=Nocardioides sp. BP30 TaxID=3036374 RepID=UPI0024690379|nr:hypothetical protein [Nocardioides sp. BP30]WGL52235.1 hypothetical protein P5P86_00030 [Nocardioides sp. BP30]
MSQVHHARPRRAWNGIVSFALLLAAVAFLPASPVAAAPSSDLTVSASGDSRVLVDAPIGYTLTAHNGASTGWQYNLSFRDVLPLGVSYVAGSTTKPAGVGDPQIITIGTAPDTQQVLIWSNVSDLPAGADQSVAFKVTVDPDRYPVGATLTDSGDVYGQTDPRTLPKFDSAGDPVAASYTDTATSTPFSTTVTAVRIDKSEDSPEHELMRGVHDDTATYTLKVTNNDFRTTRQNTVVDYLPAGLEFLGCGTVDNGTAREYGGRTLTGTPAPAGPCVEPDLVETVQLTAGNAQGLAPGVYTQVTWRIGDLAASGTWTTHYRAGIPQRENTMDFGAGGTPSPGSLGQAANLDNNTGPSTRERASADQSQDGELGLTNLAEVAGGYTGAVAAGTPTDVSDTSSVTVTAEDLAIQKSVTPTVFTQDGVATYRLDVETGEYADATDVVVTDVIPDGMCPRSVGTPAACATGAGDFTATNAGVDAVVHNADNTWTVTFSPFDLAHQDTTTITYDVLMRAGYSGHDQAPTVSGDDYTNTVSLVGTTTTLATVNAPDGGGVAIADVRDASEASIGSPGPSLTKTIMKQTSPYACGSGDYTTNAATAKDDAALRFRVGDRVCFTVRADFSSGNSTKNPTITDFLPEYVTYEPGSAVATGDDDVTVAGGGPTVTGGRVTWTIGDTLAGSPDRFVARGGVFEWRLSAIVTAEPDAAPKPDITANLAKLSWTDTAGQVGFLRDQVDFSIGATPPVAIGKTHTGFAGVVGGDVVPYTITVSNTGSAADEDDVAVHDLAVRDVLPAGVDCSLISADTPAASCSGSGTSADPSILAWTLSGPLAAGDSTQISYKMTVPTDPRILTAYPNTTGVVSYQTDTNLGTPITHYPSNTDPLLTACGADPAPTCDVPQAQVVDTVTVQNTALTKTQTTAIDQDGSHADATAVIGEEVDYVLTATVPAHTTVYQGVVADPMPSGIELLSAAADLDGGALPGGVVLATNSSADAGADGVTLSLPATYENATGSAQVFTITVHARVATGATNVQDVTLKNLATFTRKSAATGGTNLAGQQASTTATVVEPDPTVTKSHTPGGKVSGGQTLTYRLTASNTSGRPTLYDAFVVDCVPAGLTTITVTDTPAGTTTDPVTAGDGSNGCASGTRLLRWHIPSLPGGTGTTLTYTAVVDPAAVGGQSYDNTAVLTGSDLADGTEPVTAIERAYQATVDDSVTVAGSTLAKTSSTPLRAVGQLAEFTVTATVPAQVNYYDATLVDTLPDGVDASAVQLTSSTCTYPDASACSVSPSALTRSGQVVGWSLGDLTADPSARTIALTYTVPVQDAAGLAASDQLTNDAVLGWDLSNKADPTDVGTSPDTTAAPASVTDHVTEPDVSITKAVSDTTPDPGQTFTYTLEVSNANTAYASTAHQVTITDAVPTGVVVDASTISGGGSISGADPSTGGGTITWTIASLAKSGSVSLSYDASLAVPTPSAVLTNTATVASYCSIAFTAPDTCASLGGRVYHGPSDTAAVRAALPHVSIAKTVVGNGLAYIGTAKTFQLTITSDGSSEAYHVAAADVLPANWTYDAHSAQISVRGGTVHQVDPSISGQTLTWTDLADLPTSGDTVVITYSATPGASVTSSPGVGHTVNHTNTASVTAQDKNGRTADKDGHPYNGSDATATVHVDSADVTIAKAAVGTTTAGADTSWTLTVRNTAGPDTAVGPFIVTDPMPPTLTAISAGGTGWTCSTTSGTVTCHRTSTADTLAKGSAFPAITVTGHVQAATAEDTQLSNTATVADSTYDPALGNNEDTSDVIVTTAADMTVVKSLSGALVPGSDATYTLDVANDGPSVHRGALEVSDAIPAGTTFVSASGSDWTCTTPAVGSTGTIACDRSDDLPVGSVDQITVVVHVDSARTTDVLNTATVTGDDHGGTTDPDHGNDDSSVTTTPAASADLSIDKSRVDDADFVAGKQPSYLLTVHNEGPSDARAVEVSDTLPSYLSYVGFTSVDGDWSCSASGQDVTCDLADPLAASPGAHAGDVAVRIQVEVATDHRGDIANTAAVDSSTPDPVTANNSDTDDLGVGDVNADLSIAKSHPSGDVVAGEDVTYTLTVTNHGPSAHNSADGDVTVTDTLPDGLTCVSVSGAGSCAADDASATYVYGHDLAVGDSFTVTVVARVDPSAGPATLVNTASVSGPEDQNPTNDSTTDPTPVVDSAEIDLTKTVTGADPVRAGGTTTFKVTAHNSGTSDADDVTITDALPAGMTIVDLDGTGWTCDTTTLACTLATLPAGASRSVTVEVRVNSGVADGTTLTNHASVTTTTDGDDPADDTAKADVDVVAEADLALVKKHVGADDVVAGTDTSYTLDVRNLGPSDAQGPITVTDTLPDGTSYLSADGGWACSAAGQVVTCTLAGPLVSGTAATTLTMLVHVDADLDANAAATNSASVSSSTTDPDLSDNDDDATVSISRGADVSIVKSHTGTGEIGGAVTFTLAVHNAGPSTARAVVVSDPLPAGLTFVSADGGPDWTCTYDDGDRTLGCDLAGPLAADTDAAPIAVTATVDATAYPGVTNVASVTTQTPDGDPEDNTSADTLEVDPRADLSLVKTHTGPLVVGEETHYTLTVHNAGPTDAPDTVTVTDPLPAGLTYVAATGPGWSCKAVAGAMVCQRAGLDDGATSAIDLVVTVGPKAYPSLTNVATVSSRSADLRVSNNASDDPAHVTPTVDLVVKKKVAFQHGSSVGWDIAVTNAGPSATVAAATVVDKLPSALHYVSAHGPGWDCGVVGQRITCTRTSPLASGAASTVRVVTTLDAKPGAVIHNVATVSGGGGSASDSSRPGSDGSGGSTSSAKVTAPSQSASTASGSGGLPNTGGPLWWLAPLGALLVLAGALLLRRRRS